MLSLPQRGSVSQTTQPRSPAQGSLFSTGLVEREKLSALKRLQLNNCADVAEVCTSVWKLISTPLVRLCLPGTQTILDCSGICPAVFPSSSSPINLGPIWERSHWVRSFDHSHKHDFLNLPRGREEAKCDYSASQFDHVTH